MVPRSDVSTARKVPLELECWTSCTLTLVLTKKSKGYNMMDLLLLMFVFEFVCLPYDFCSFQAKS